MKRFNIFLIIFSAIILSAGKINAEAEGGRVSGNFLLLGAGAKSISLGNAMTSSNYGLFALKYNPASIADNSVSKIGFSYSSYFENISHHYLGYQWKNLGVYIQYLDYGKFDRTTYTGFDQILGNFSAQDICAAVSYGYSLHRWFNSGISFKYIKSRLAEYSANAVAVDFGVQKEFSLFDENIRTGFSILNLGSKLKYMSKDENLPRTYRIGFSCPILDNFDFNFDFVKTYYDNFGIQSGIEWKYKNTLAVCLGYDGLNEASKKISIGFGLKYSRMEFDYAFVPYNDLDSMHNLTLQYQFGLKEKNIEAEQIQDENWRSFMKPAYCQNCGKYLKPYFAEYNLRFCPECGKKIIYQLEK
ncbi:PorV/PorQ family protein [Candidatus Dependentiae bacterium]|nr:PorV/PorQ family protein [Candidatus Dependentiae bacterium]